MPDQLDRERVVGPSHLVFGEGLTVFASHDGRSRRNVEARQVEALVAEGWRPC